MNMHDEIMAEIAKRRILELTADALRHNALLTRITARKREEWAALPWRMKLRRKVKAHFRSAIWRIKAAWRVLRTGDLG